MPKNPFAVTKTEEFNNRYQELAALLYFTVPIEHLLSRSNVFIEGSRGSGKSMFLKFLSLEGQIAQKELEEGGKIKPLPPHDPFTGVYVKLEATLYGPNEYEDEPHFDDLFLQFFNLHCVENILRTIDVGERKGELEIGSVEEEATLQALENLLEVAILAGKPRTFHSLYLATKDARADARRQLNRPPYSTGRSSAGDFLWTFCGTLCSEISCFSSRRFYILLDEFDNLTEHQQRLVNTLVRKRDFPITFKIATKKHKVVYEDRHRSPLNQFDDYELVELDDNDFGIGSTFLGNIEKIANLRLEQAGVTQLGIRKLLGVDEPERFPGTEAQYYGFRLVATLSSGIVRPFLEFCREMYAKAGFEKDGAAISKIPGDIQDHVLKDRAEHLYNRLRDVNTSEPQLEALVSSIGNLFLQKASTLGEKENQVIRLEVLDYHNLPRYTRYLFHRALEFEALVVPNRSRVEKNRPGPSTGFILNRLLCVHFRIFPSSRWDVEVTAGDVEQLLSKPDETIKSLVRGRKKGARKGKRKTMRATFYDHLRMTPCPVLDQLCDYPEQEPFTGFLAIRLPKTGKIRDAKDFLIQEMAKRRTEQAPWELKSAEELPPEGDIACKACYRILKCGFGLYEVTKLSANVMFELGIAIANRRKSFILLNIDESKEPPEPIGSLEYISYSITSKSVGKLLDEKVIPALQGPSGRGGDIGLGAPETLIPTGKQAFLALPGDNYYQETVKDALEKLLTEYGYSCVVEKEGRELHELQRAIVRIAESEICLIDTTFKDSVRSMYLGVALGYKKPFSNLVDIDKDSSGAVFTDAKQKCVVDYKDIRTLTPKIRQFLDNITARR